jgi:hypothetical protein
VISLVQFLCLGLGTQAAATLVTIWCKQSARDEPVSGRGDEDPAGPVR